MRGRIGAHTTKGTACLSATLAWDSRRSGSRRACPSAPLFSQRSFSVGVVIISPDARDSTNNPQAGSVGDLTKAIGESVLTRFVLPFELLAFLMLAALLGAIYFARPEE